MHIESLLFQEVLDGKFQKYDFGAKENMKRYNQVTVHV